MPFVFYDTETTGTDTAFDQILQFAAIKTDDDLNVLDTFNTRCRILPWIVPAPTALVVTGVSIETLKHAPLSHYEMMSEVHRTMRAWSAGGAVFLGWNSLQFDERMLRQAYYQCLLPVYQTVTYGNGRGDVMRMAQVASIYAPDALVVPRTEDGKATFRLERVAEANGVILSNAHEALADATATLGVARLVKQRTPALWTQFVSNARKANLQRLLDENEFLLLLEHYGAPTASVVTPITSRDNDSAAVALFDLRFDPSAFLDRSPEAIAADMAASPKAIRTVRLNAQPGLLPYSNLPAHLSAALQPREICIERARRVREDAGFQASVRQAMNARFEGGQPSPYVEAQIFTGFATAADMSTMARFHRSNWKERARLIEAFEDNRHRELAWRIVDTNAGSELDQSERVRWGIWKTDRISCDDDVPWRTRKKALAELEALRREARGSPTQLAEIGAFISGIPG